MLLASTVFVLGLAGGELPRLPDLFGPEQAAVASVATAPLPPVPTEGWVLGIPLDVGGCSETQLATLDSASDWRGLFAWRAEEWAARS